MDIVIFINRGGQRNPATFKMEFFAAIAHGFQPWTSVVKFYLRCDSVAEGTCAKWSNRCFGKLGALPIFDKSYQFIQNFRKIYLKNVW